MKRWPTKKIGELCDVANERASEGTIPYLEIGNLDPKTKEYELSDKPSVKGALAAKAGDILVSRVRPTRGAIALLRENGFAVSSAFTILRPRHEITNRFLFLTLAWNGVFPTYLGRHAKGALYPTVTEHDVLAYEVPVPLLAEQERIVKLLDEADELRKLRTQADRRATALIPAIFHEMFGDPIANSKGFPTTTLGELASVERGRFTPRPRNDPSYFDGKYPFIQTGDIANSNGLVTQYSQTLNEKGKTVSKEFPAGAIVIAIVGATIGRTAILGIPVFATDSVIAIQPHRDQVVTEYIHYVLQFWRPVFIAQAPETARANLNAATLKAVKIPIPPLLQQKEFAQRVKEIRELETSQATSRTRLDALFQSMLHRAFNGEL